MQHELDLQAEPDAVPRARRFVLTALDRETAAGLADDLALIVTELATNAVLHAGPPITVRVLDGGDRVRVEVEDPDPRPPLLPRQSTEAMTGRGLALVAAMADRWGVDPSPHGGKVVWAEVSLDREADGPAGPGPLDLADLTGLADLADLVDLADLTAGEPGEVEGPGDPRTGPARAGAGEAAEVGAAADAVAVRVARVPVRLLLDTESTADGLAREFALTSAGSGTGGAEPLPEHLTDVVEAVARGFAGPRAEVKRQALAAAARGEEHCDLALRLRPGDADEAERFLAALDEADDYARAARLLTLESPPAQRVLRRWYVGELVGQLRARAAGTHPPVTFEQRLQEEVTALSAARRSLERAARLQSVTAPLAAAETAEDVAGVVVGEGMAALGASRAAVLAPGGRPQAGGAAPVRALAAVGYPAEVLRGWAAAGASPDSLLGQVLLTGEPVWLESAQERDQRFPLAAGLEPPTAAACAVPMTSGGRVVAALRLSFEQPRIFDAEERQFVQALAGQAAQALHRSDAYAAERAARAEAERLADHLADTANRLARLQHVTAELTGARDPEQVADVVVGNAASAFGALASVLYLLGDDGRLHVAATAGARLNIDAFTDLPLHAEVPAAEAVRTGLSVAVPDRAALLARYPLLRDAVTGDRAVLVAPLTLPDRRLGCLVLVFPAEQAVDLPTQQRFLESIADAAAQALERARATSRAEQSANRLAFLAEASVELSGSLDYRTTLTSVARLVVPRVADWCSVVLVEDGRLETVTVAHTDPEKVAWARRLQERYPVDPEAGVGVPQVVRTGRTELHVSVGEELLVASARDDEHLALLRGLGLSSVLIVPLTGRTGVLGAITMVAAESGRHYGPDDVALAEDLARRAALAVETAQSFRAQSGRLAAVTRVAEAAQQAVLSPVPARVGPFRLAAAYASATAEARVGGDLYEVVPRPWGLRLVVGDVRGKGLEAVRTATVVLGEFRAAAVDCDGPAEVARQVDRRLPTHLGEEDFVTALIADVRDDGTVEVVTCGHPPALVVRGGRAETLGVGGSLPLGLGVTPVGASTRLQPGDRLLLHTDGLVRALAPDAAPDLAEVVRVLADGDLATVPDRVLQQARAADGPGLGDDLALLVVEYDPAGAPAGGAR